jgi:hypothetical protein
MSGPLLGHVFDRNARAIRAVSGVPGAAGVEAAVALDQSFSVAFVHPTLPVAIGTGKSGGVYTAAWSEADQRIQVRVATKYGAPSEVVFAAAIDCALLISEAGVELWGGLANTPTLVYAVPADLMAGSPRIAALSDDGAVAAVALESGDIIELSADSVRRIGQGVSATYIRQTTELLVIDKDGAVTRIRDDARSVIVGQAPSGSYLAGVSGSGRVLAWNPASGIFTLTDIDTGATSNVECDCRPVRVRALRSDGIWFVEDEDGAAFLADTTAGTTRLTPLAGFNRGSDL